MINVHKWPDGIGTFSCGGWENGTDGADRLVGQGGHSVPGLEGGEQPSLDGGWAPQAARCCPLTPCSLEEADLPARCPADLAQGTPSGFAPLASKCRVVWRAAEGLPGSVAPEGSTGLAHRPAKGALAPAALGLRTPEAIAAQGPGGLADEGKGPLDPWDWPLADRAGPWRAHLLQGRGSLPGLQLLAPRTDTASPATAGPETRGPGEPRAQAALPRVSVTVAADAWGTRAEGVRREGQRGS